MIRRLLTICFLASFVLASADDELFEPNTPVMSARFEADSVGIGDHIKLMIDVDQDVMQRVAFPEFDTSGDSYLELVREPKLDTLEIEGRRIKLRREYLFTTFEEGMYNIGRASILYAGKSGADTIYAGDSLRFTVSTFLIDSTSHSIFDLKPQRNLPFKFGEISGYVMWICLGLLLLTLLIVIILRVLAYYGRPVMGLFQPEPPVAPHVAAFAALDELRGERLWQDGEYKSYYSRLTDILRTYISGRYGVAAMEMTSDEIVVAVRDLDLPTQCEMELRDLLRDADLVKFAKAEFAATQNEHYFESARLFVDLTKPEEQTLDNDDDELAVRSDNEDEK